MIELPQLTRRAKRAPSASQPRSPRWFRVENAADSESADVYIYDAIAWFGVDVNDLVDELDEITARTINVRINSPGGDVFDGVAIYNALVRHDARIVVHVDGLAASIASVIAMAGDEVRMNEGSFFMIHDPWMLAIGPAEEMRSAADLLDKIGNSIAAIYEKRTGLPRAEITALMNAETWMDAEEARDKGFADAVEEADDDLAIAASFDLSAFEHPPERLAAQARPAADNNIETIRDFENFLRDVGGFSKNAARAIAAGGYKATSDAWDEPDGSQKNAIDTEVMAELGAAVAIERARHSFNQARKSWKRN